MIDYYGIPESQINNIKNGMDWVLEDGDVIPNSRLVTPADPVRSYAYCSDTKYMPQLSQALRGVTTLYHESTYGEDNKKMPRSITIPQRRRPPRWPGMPMSAS